jgi:hypothetical protein
VSTQDQRGYQMFPVLDAARVETALRFASGLERHFAPGEIVYDHGQQDAPSWLVLSGSGRDGLDREAPIVTFGPGQFTGEVNQLAGRPCDHPRPRLGARRHCSAFRRAAPARADDRLGRDRRDCYARADRPPRRPDRGRRPPPARRPVELAESGNGCRGAAHGGIAPQIAPALQPLGLVLAALQATRSQRPLSGALRPRIFGARSRSANCRGPSRETSQLNRPARRRALVRACRTLPSDCANQIIAFDLGLTAMIACQDAKAAVLSAIPIVTEIAGFMKRP